MSSALLLLPIPSAQSRSVFLFSINAGEVDLTEITLILSHTFDTTISTSHLHPNITDSSPPQALIRNTTKIELKRMSQHFDYVDFSNYDSLSNEESFPSTLLMETDPVKYADRILCNSDTSLLTCSPF